MLDVDRIEPHDRGEEPDICFCYVLTIIVGPIAFVRLGRKVGFCAVEGGEERVDAFFIGFLGGGETGFVDAIVDVIVGPGVGIFNVLFEGGGEKVDGCIVGGKDIVEFGVEHADDFGGLGVLEAF